MTIKKKRLVVFVFIAVTVALLLVFIHWSNNALELNTYILTSDALPSEFDGFRIAHVSDLHNAEMGSDNQKLIDILRDAEPDIIAITGDLIDSRNTNTEMALLFAKQAMEIAPCYYVSGNHEARASEYSQLKDTLSELGVIVLDNKRIEIGMGDKSILIIGVDDPSFQSSLTDSYKKTVDDELSRLITDDGRYTVLLSHRPELFELYADKDIKLALCGHAHGGQFRLPFVGGLFAPGQGLFPEYDSGLYEKGNTDMIVSRGIGNSIMPIRINNPPEVILTELYSQK
jgi:predicted MPP superfamily phosphohydrolase